MNKTTVNKIVLAVVIIIVCVAGWHLYSENHSKVKGFYSETSPFPVYGAVNATTTSSQTTVLQPADIVGYSTLLVTPITNYTSLVLPASSSLSTWLPVPGESTQFILYDSSTTANTNIGLIGTTTGGSTVISASSTATTTQGKYSIITVLRLPTTNLLFSIQPNF